MKVNLICCVILNLPIILYCELLLRYDDTNKIKCDTPIHCLSDNIFTFCFIVNGSVVISEDTYTCPDGYSCSNQDGQTPCRISSLVDELKSTSSYSISSSTTMTTATTATVVTSAPAASLTTTTTTTTTTNPSASCSLLPRKKFPASNCNQFYECTQVLWWYTIRLRTCPNQQHHFHPQTNQCVNIKRNNCQ